MFTTNEISNIIKDKIANFSDHITPVTHGKILSVSDGVVKIYGLNQVKYGEKLLFPEDKVGLAFNLEQDCVGAIVFGSTLGLQEGQEVYPTGEVLKVAVGPGLLGRVVNALAEPLDGLGELNNVEYDQVEKIAPGVIFRASVNEPLQTGIKSIDAMIPIGLGQRELIIGDRQTGKTAIAIDTIINQKNKNIKCIYVAIGQKASSVAKLAQVLAANGAMEYTTIISATASEAASLQYIAPYVGCTMGEYYRDRGENALIIYDDLTKHSWAYRQISLLLRRPPGREAYPGDIFYLHAKLLERAAKVSPEFIQATTGIKNVTSGSLTALPIVETQAGDISTFIPTNVISITDGQIFLEADLFNAGIRPAINAGISVSRVGGAAQAPLIKKLSGKIRLTLAQYNELAAFAQFAQDLDINTQTQLKRGKIITELMKQPQYKPFAVANMAIILYAINEKFFDNYELVTAAAMQNSLLIYAEQKYNEVIKEINKNPHGDDEQMQQIAEIIADFKNHLDNVN